MAVVDQVANSLSDEVVADGPDLQPVPRKEFMSALTIAVVGKSFLHVEVIAPTRQFQPVEAPARRLFREGLERNSESVSKTLRIGFHRSAKSA